MARPVMVDSGSWLLVGLGAGWCDADAWTDALFTENRHDFGMVPRGVKVKHDFLHGQPAGGADHDPQPAALVRLHERAGECVAGRPGPDARSSRPRWTRATSSGPKSTILYRDPDHGERARRRSAAGRVVA